MPRIQILSAPPQGCEGEAIWDTSRQITSGERYAIAALRHRGLSAREIATELGRAHTTISREIRRNLSSQGWYTPIKANQKCRGRRTRSRRGARIASETWTVVERLLRLDWSPKQASGFLRAERILAISHEAIYVHVWHDKTCGGDLWKHMRQAGKKRRKRHGRYDSQGKLAGKRHISERPPEVENRIETGHWEIDTVMDTEHGRNSVLTLVERATAYTVIGKLDRHCAAEATAAVSNSCTATRACRHHRRRQRFGVPQLQRDRSGHRSRLLLRDPAPLVGSRHQREHERADPAVLAEEDEPRPRHASGLRRSRRQAQLAATQATGIQDTGGVLCSDQVGGRRITLSGALLT